MKLIIFVASALLITGCASVQRLNTSSTEIGKSVEFGVQTNASVGDVLYSEYNFKSQEGVEALNSFSQSVMMGKVQLNGGEFLTPYVIDNKKAYCTNSLTYIDPLLGPYRSTCFVDANQDMGFDKLLVRPGAVFFERDLETELKYKKHLKLSEANGYKYELLYNGISGNTINIAYREYLNDIARPAYQQNLQYTLNNSEPTPISFKGVLLNIYTANNLQIMYEVNSGFKH